MSNLSLFLFTFILLGVISTQAQAQEREARNEREVNFLQNEVLQAWPGTGEAQDSGMYIAFDWGVRPSLSSFGESEGEFSIENGQAVRAGIVPLTPQKNFGDMAFGVGFQKILGKRVRVRYEGGLKWLGLDYGNPTYTTFDFAPMPLEEVNRLVNATDGTLQITNPHADIFFDFKLGNTENFLYLGTGIGYVKATSRYELSIGDFSASMDDTDWTRVNSFEAGLLFRLGERMALRTAYHFNKFQNFNLTTNTGSQVDLALNNQHSFKIGIIHFLRRR